jgi:hypothetical protein
VRNFSWFVNKFLQLVNTCEFEMNWQQCSEQNVCDKINNEFVRNF